MKSLAKVGLIIFAVGTILSTTLLALQIGGLIHLQTYRHGLTQFGILDSTFFLALFFAALVCIPIGLGLIFLKTNRVEPIKKIKFFAIIFLITGLISGLAFVSALNSDINTRSHTTWNDVERVLITAAGFNSTQNSISVTAKSMNELSGNVTLTNIIIKNQTGSTIINIPISDKLNVLEFTTLRSNLNSTLPSGTYTVTLATTKGSSFVSPNFTVP